MTQLQAFSDAICEKYSVVLFTWGLTRDRITYIKSTIFYFVASDNPRLFVRLVTVVKEGTENLGHIFFIIADITILFFLGDHGNAFIVRLMERRKGAFDVKLPFKFTLDKSISFNFFEDVFVVALILSLFLYSSYLLF